MYMLFLSKDNLELAGTEAEKLLELKASTLKDNILLTHINKKIIQNKKYSRLAYTKKVLELLFMCNPKNLGKALESYDWKIYKKNFCLRIHNDKRSNEKSGDFYDEKEYSKHIWKGIEKNKKQTPKVDLKNPETFIEIIIISNKAFVCLKIWDNQEHFDSRKAHLRPEMHPTGMHPKMARALINILNPRSKEKIVDPFCGTGGIILEAGLMNIKSEGCDINPAVLRMAEINLKHYEVDKKLYSLKKKDFMKAKKLINVVTDIPYGKSSMMTGGIKDLYKNFIRKIDGKTVVVFPSFVNSKKLLKENLKKKLKVKKTIKQYVHKSLTRNIIVIE